MAETDLSGFNGSVTLPTGHYGKASGFTVRRQMNTKSTNRYGGDRFARARGGILTIGGDISVFLRMGVSPSTPGIVSPTADGSALTLTLESGCTLSGTALFPDLTINHTFEDPAIQGTFSYQFNGTVTEAWATGA